MKLVKDALYNFVKLSDLDIQLMDTPQMQRLRYIKQIALGYLVYPGANHTRFEHSLGTLFLAKRFYEINEQPLDIEIACAALLHDVGHGPFSHESEHIFAKEGLSHEYFSEKKIKDGQIAEILERAGVSPSAVAACVAGKGKGKLLTGTLGIDRIDYLMRDSYYSGVMYGKLDYERLLTSMSVSGSGELLISEKGIEAAESLVVSRFMMFSALYQHKAVGISSGMLRKAMDLAYSDGVLSAQELAEMTDIECLQSLGRHPQAGYLAGRLVARKLYKAALVLRGYEIPEQLKNAIDEKFLSRLEDELCASCGLAPEEIVSYYTYSSYKPITVSVKGKSEIRDLSEISEVVKSICDASEKKRMLFVAVPEEKRDMVAKKAQSIINSYR
ncbi:MAG: HD domain-containing protein [Candidatus Micrarchaeota archaeon]|nr:HD domain-containing protein [Candidatus Micrarchaeota archaeon]